MVKMFNKEVVSQSKPEIRDFLEPVQLGISIAGPALLTRSVSGIMEAFQDYICFRLDLKNAFNEISRRSILDVLDSEEMNQTSIVSKRFFSIKCIYYDYS